MDGFKAGSTYTLRVDEIWNFCFTDTIRDKVGIMPGQYTTFTFTPTEVQSNGNAFVDTVCVATSGEFGLFDLIDEPQPEPTTPKVKKPFKVGATYKLKKKYVRDFLYTSSIRRVYGEGVFSFTVSDVEAHHILSAEIPGSSVATADERYMFTRIDNK